MKEVDNVLRIFKEVETAINENQAAELRRLSDQTVHTASISQDPDNIAVAVIIYSLSKIMERGYLKEDKKEEIRKKIKELIFSLKKEDERQIKNDLINLRKSLEKFSGKMKDYIKDVLEKASINKASKIYEHGISMEKTASLLGVTMFDLASYSGQKSSISDISENKTVDVKSRIKLAMEMFR